MSAAVPGGEHQHLPAVFSRPTAPPKGPRLPPWERESLGAESRITAEGIIVQSPTAWERDDEVAVITTLARSRRTKRAGNAEWATLVDPPSPPAEEPTPPFPPYRRRKSSTYSTILRTYASAVLPTPPASPGHSVLILSDPPTSDLGRSKRMLDNLLAHVEAACLTIDAEASFELPDVDSDAETEEASSPYHLPPFPFSTAGRPRRLVDVNGDSFAESDIGAVAAESNYNEVPATRNRKVGRSDSGYATDQDTEDPGVPGGGLW
ncbi:hypothetical protein HDU86_003666 [Geranomyces michiganensis]|nr:hypothetical protein HDU86_003666 [Geranomyces michiganensis]